MAKLFCIIIPILILSFFHQTSSTAINCNFGSRGGWVIGNLYSCTITNNPLINTPEKALIDNITGTQAAGKTFDDDTAFFSDKTIQYIPRGLDKFFKNLIGIYIFGGRLKEIHQNDFKFYPKLRALDFYNNDIDILEDGLFDFNPNLEVISFSHNKIFHIGNKVFETLTKLASLSLNENVCSEYQVAGNLAAIQAAVPGLKNACKSQKFLDLDDEIEFLENHSKSLTRDNFWNFEIRFIDFEREFKDEYFLRFLPLSLRYEVLKELKIDDLPEMCKKCCQFDEFQEKNFEFLKNILDATASLKAAQDDQFAILNARISELNFKIDQFDGKIASLNQVLNNLTVSFNNFVTKFNNFEDLTAAKFAIIENKINEIAAQTTDAILSAVDLKLRNLENRLIKAFKNNNN